MSVVTNLIFTTDASVGERYEPIMVYNATNGNIEIDIFCYFSENVLSLYKDTKTYDVVKLNIYGVKF